MLTKEKGTIKTYASSRSGNFMRSAEASSSKNERNFTKNSESSKKNSPLAITILVKEKEGSNVQNNIII